MSDLTNGQKNVTVVGKEVKHGGRKYLELKLKGFMTKKVL